MPGQPCHSWWLWWHHTNLLLSTISPTNGSARMCNVHSGLMNCEQVVMFISWGEMPMQPVTKNFDNIICWSSVRYNYRMMKWFETCCVCTCLDLYTFMVVCVFWCHCGDKIEPRLHETSGVSWCHCPCMPIPAVWVHDIHVLSHLIQQLACVSSTNGQLVVNADGSLF